MTSKTRVEYVKTKAFWGDMYIVKVYEEQNNMPGFAPTTFDVHVCDIWVEYSDWEKRIEFNDCRVEQISTLKAITKHFTSPHNRKRFKEEVKS